MARSFVQLNMDERRLIAQMHEKKISQAEIAAVGRRESILDQFKPYQHVYVKFEAVGSDDQITTTQTHPLRH